MLTGKKIILFGAGFYGRRALNYFGSDRVYCFVDNVKASQTYLEKRVISFSEVLEIKDNYNIVLSVGLDKKAALTSQCAASGIECDCFYDLVSHDGYESNPEMKQFENKHKGERCFLVGNGPSLTAEDLTTLHKHSEVSIACNAIRKIFHKTPWRPKYYMVGDPMIYEYQCEMLADTEAEYKFLREFNDMLLGNTTEIAQVLERSKGQIVHYRQIHAVRNDGTTCFSPDASRGIYALSTVMYPMIQMAVYMGFKEIFLIGVDGDVTTPKQPEDYLSEKRHFYDDDKDLVFLQSARTFVHNNELSSIYTAKAYDQAEKYTREHGIRILNATRGGKLEAFERVDFDLLF